MKLDDGNVSSLNMAMCLPNQKKKSKTIIRLFYKLIFLGSIFGYVAEANSSSSQPLYVVVIDAGSTGSRVFAFTFHKSTENGNLVLDNEFFHQVKPGLSSYADNLTEVTKSLEVLVNKAKSVIPQSEWTNTPFLLKATAGLRLLPEEKSKAILNVSRNFLKDSGFLITNKSISIMEGIDEGVFSWSTVNFLLGRFNQNSSQKTVAALDLGGGSAQVTFCLDEEDKQILNQSIIKFDSFKEPMYVFSHSYLGFGLMASRKAILTQESATTNDNGIVEVHSKCFDPLINTTWQYGGIEYHIMGSEEAANSTGGMEKNATEKFQNCLNLVEKHTNTAEIKPVGLKKQEINAFSYIFDRTSESGLIDPFEGGMSTIGDIHKAAISSCNNPTTAHPFMCLDLSYIYSLLTNIYGLEPETKLKLSSRIAGHQVSWTLGLALNVLQSKI